jgi:hypothetical protein
MASDYRSEEREVGYFFRMTKDERNRLHREADAEGLSLQQLLELRALGEAKPRRRSGPQVQTERLDISA